MSEPNPYEITIPYQIDTPAGPMTINLKASYIDAHEPTVHGQPGETISETVERSAAEGDAQLVMHEHPGYITRDQFVATGMTCLAVGVALGLWTGWHWWRR